MPETNEGEITGAIPTAAWSPPPEAPPEAAFDAPPSAPSSAQSSAPSEDESPPVEEYDPPPTLLDRALATGSLTTIATGGALIGLGLREGDTSRAFRLAGRGLMQRVTGASTGAPLASVGIGYLHHLLVATFWGTVLGLLVLRLTGFARLVAAVVVTAAYVWCSADYVPVALRIGYSVTSTMGSAVSIGVALLVALLGGIWLDATDTPE